MFQVKNIYNRSDESLAKELVNNWRKFDSFAMFDETIRDSDNYTIVYTQNRDGDLLTQSNAAEIDKRLKPFADMELSEDQPMLIGVSCSHWLCGWVEGYAIAVYDPSTESGLTPAFEECCEIARELDDYPCLNEDDWSMRESDEEWDYLIDLATECERDSDYEIPFTAGDLMQAIDDHNIPFGFGYYGECYIKAEDLEQAAFFASLETYRDMNCSD